MKNTKQNIFIFMIFTVFCISALGSVSAADTGNNTTTNNTTSVTANFTNPGFESGNLTGWTARSTTTITTNSHSGTYGAHFNNIANQTTDNLTQTVDLTNINNITFWGYGEETAGTTYSFYVYIDNNLITSIIPTSDAWTQYTIPTSGYTGLHNITVTWYGQCMYGADVDDFSINAPTANFTTNTTNGTSPLTVQFNDTSTDNPTSWLWNFGDGTTSTLQNPTHTYTTLGIYTVTLTVTNEADNNKVSDNGKITKTNYITVTDATKPLIFINTQGGAYNTTLNITLTTIDQYGATTTYYTTDDTDPQTSNTRTEYTGPITINQTTTLRYSAINSKNIWSPEYTQTYTLDFIAPSAVTNNLSGGTYNTTQTITLTSSDSSSDFTIYYTTEGTDPRTSTTRITYTGPITINQTTTLRYVAIDPAGNTSPVGLQNYVIGNGTITYTNGQSNNTGPTTNNTEWTYTVTDGYDGDYAFALGSDGTLYVGTFNGAINDGYFYAISPKGTIKWTYHTGAVSALTIGSDGTIYVKNYDGMEYAFNSNGTLEWNATENLTNTAFTTIGADGTKYIVSDGYLYAFNTDGTLKWQFSTETLYGVKLHKVGGAPLIGSDGTLYILGLYSIVYQKNGQTLYSTVPRLYAINPDGTIKWTYDTPTPISTICMGKDGTIYLAGHTGSPYVGNVYAINLDGTVKWTYTAGGGIWGGISIGSDGTIYFATSNNYYDGVSACSAFCALYPNGTLKWNYTTYKVSYEDCSGTIGADGTIYFGGNDGNLYAFNSDGTLKWTYTVGRMQSCPIIGPDGTLYFLTVNGKVGTIKDIPVANFTTNTTNGNSPLSVQFTDNSTSTPTSWNWDFGDGTTSTEQNPTHTYTKPGIYTVTLKADNNAGSSTKTSTIIVLDVTSPTVIANSTGGLFNTAQNVTLTTTDNSGNSTTYYTTDGTDPTTSSTRSVYTGPITINNTKTLQYTAVDPTGNWSPIYTQNYTIDTTTPTVKTVTPTNSASNVAVNKVITVTFNETIKAGNGWIELKNNNGTPLPITWSINGNILTVTANSTLAHGIKYTLLIHTGSVTDLADNNIAGYVSRFTTSTDTTAPTVKTVTPTNNAVNVAADKVIKVTFSETITKGTGWIELTTSNGTVVPSTWSINGNVLTIKTNSTLTHGVKYTLLIHTGSVTDLADNNLKGYVTRFTVDSIAPTVKTVDPTNNAVNVAANKVIKVTFNEAIKAGTGWIELTTSNGTVVPTTWSINGNVLTITPSNALSKGVKYTLLIHTGSVTDLAGNNVKGYVTRFTTITT